MIELREAQDTPQFGPSPVLVISAYTDEYGNALDRRRSLTITRQQAVELHDRLAELVERWR